MSHPKSCIAKIYGIFQFERKNVKDSEKTFIFLMRNLKGCPNEFVERTFDMKGIYLY